MTDSYKEQNWPRELANRTGNENLRPIFRETTTKHLQGWADMAPTTCMPLIVNSLSLWNPHFSFLTSSSELTKCHIMGKTMPDHGYTCYFLSWQLSPSDLTGHHLTKLDTCLSLPCIGIDNISFIFTFYQ